jgi:hypothetical protein
MGLFTNPVGYAGYPPNATAPSQRVNSTVRAATLAEAQAGVRTDCYISPGTAAASTSAGAFTTLTSSGNTTLGTTGASINTLGSTNVGSTTAIKAGVSTITLTTTGGNYPGKLASTPPAAGFLGEQIRQTKAKGAAVALTSTVTSNITSVSLTTGIWDVSGICAMTGGAITGTIFEAAISTTSATLGTIGDDDVQTPTMATATSDSTLTVPSLRISLAATTTVYLVANATYTVGAATAYGRLSATRVA